MASRRRQAGSREATEDTKSALCRAARAEFAEHGFGGTDTNKIARRAGFAPQTFYRWYRDKTAVFVAAYQAWEEEERATIEARLAEAARPRALAEAIVAHHRAHRLFRRSLRELALSDPEVRRARAQSRQRQAERILRWLALPKRRAEATLLTLFQIERLADAAAEGELTDLGLSESSAVTAIADLIARLKP